MDAYKYADESTLQFKDERKDWNTSLWSRKEGAILQESARRLRDLLSSPTANILCYCFSEIKKQLILREGAEEDQHVELAVLASGSSDMQMNDTRRNYTVCFQYASTGYSYTGLTIHARVKSLFASG